MVKYEVISGQLEQLWANHRKGEFESKDVEATLVTMVEDASVNHMPVNIGGGERCLAAFLSRRLYSVAARKFKKSFGSIELSAPANLSMSCGLVLRTSSRCPSSCST
jgi:hypothetical protein